MRQIPRSTERISSLTGFNWLACNFSTFLYAQAYLISNIISTIIKRAFFRQLIPAYVNIDSDTGKLIEHSAATDHSYSAKKSLRDANFNRRQ